MVRSRTKREAFAIKLGNIRSTVKCYMASATLPKRYKYSSIAAFSSGKRSTRAVPILLASSDMSHYIPATEALKKDEIALKHIEQIDAEGLYESVLQEDISMCGFVPTTCVLEACKLLGAKTSKRLSYSTSGEVTGDFSSVVAYANALFQ